MRIIDCEQRSPEWFEHRIGCLTASEAHKIITLPRAKKEQFSATQQSYIMQKCAETLTGQIYQFDNAACRWGREHEDAALERFGPHEKVGFVLSDRWDKVGCSPDARASNMPIEAKCPHNSLNHIAHLTGNIKKEYLAQMQFQMWVCESELGMFLSYDPRMPEAHQLYQLGFAKDEKMHALFEEWVPKLLEAIDETLIKIMGD